MAKLFKLGERSVRAKRKPRLALAPAIEQLEEVQLLSASSISLLSTAVANPAQLPIAVTINPGGFTPLQIRSAYGFNKISFNGVPGDGRGQTIALVELAHDQFIGHDLTIFDQQFNLAPPPNFNQVQLPGTGPDDGTFSPEESLDVEWAHAIAPKANILVVEAGTVDDSISQAVTDLANAITFAKEQPGVSVVSISYGIPEQLMPVDETTLDNVFTTPPGHIPVTFVASSGDDKFAPIFNGPLWPSVSPNVLAVGGTSLFLKNGQTYSDELSWEFSQGGISTEEAEPSYQKGFQTTVGGVKDTLFRTTPDVSYDADPNTGFAQYDSTIGGWFVDGGTSAGAPQWAALVAIANQGRVGKHESTISTLPAAIYGLPAADFHNVSIGPENQDGFAPHAGYNYVTGRGSPKANLIVPALTAGSAKAAATVKLAALKPGTGFNSTLAAEAQGVAMPITRFSVTDPGGSGATTPTSTAAWTQPATTASGTSLSADTVSGFAGVAGGGQSEMSESLATTASSAVVSVGAGPRPENGTAVAATIVLQRSADVRQHLVLFAAPGIDLGVEPPAVAVADPEDLSPGPVETGSPSTLLIAQATDEYFEKSTVVVDSVDSAEGTGSQKQGAMLPATALPFLAGWLVRRRLASSKRKQEETAG